MRWIKIIGLLFFVCFKQKTTNPLRIRIFLERAGGAFIKFGQILALRQDFLPFGYVVELLKLLNRIPETPFEKMKIVFIEETGVDIDKFFKEFDSKPIASASIGQVYQAYLMDGTKVAVKIQRPEIKEVFEADFRLMMLVAKIIDFFRIFSTVHMVELVTDFINWTRRELDFTFESKNGEIFYKHSDSHPKTIIPRQYPELSRPRVLVQEFIEDEMPIDKIISGQIKKNILFERGINVDEMVYYLIFDEMRQYFIDGFFHADPHPANLAFLPGNNLAYFDFGIVGEAGPYRSLFLKIIYGVAQKDSDYLCDHFLEFGQSVMEEELKLYLQANPSKKHKYRKIFDKIRYLIAKEFKQDIKNILDPWFEKARSPYASISEKSIAPVFFKIIREAERYGVRLPRDVILFFRAFFILDMVSLQLSPGFDIIKSLNIFFSSYPIEYIEELILVGEHESKVGKKIIPLEDIDWETFKENIFIERERKMAMEEILVDMVTLYSEKYDEVRLLLKTVN